MKNLSIILYLFVICMYSCSVNEESPKNQNYEDAVLKRNNITISKSDVLGFVVSNYNEAAAYNNFENIKIPFFKDELWSYAKIESNSNLNLNIPFRSVNSTEINIFDVGRCATDPEDPLGGYLPIPYSIAYNGDYNLVPVNSNGNGDYSTNPEDPLGGYLPIPPIIVHYNLNGINYVEQLSPNVEFFVTLMQSGNLKITD